MRIAQVAPLQESVPPKAYGGTERIVDYLSTELIRLGHDVTVFASGDSRPQARLVSCCERGIRLETELVNDTAEHLAMMQMVADMEDDYDIIHFHTEALQMPFFTHCPEKTVTTLHGRLDMKGLRKFYRRFSEFPLVSISHTQRRPLPAANWAGNIYHGIPADMYQYTPPGRQSYLAFLGRFSPEKGAHHAIDIAHESDMPIRIAAKICAQFHANEIYYANVISPRLRESHVEYVGEITDDEKSAFLGEAAALLMPIEWPEPFGIAMIEAMACGTPVIAFRHGSVPEVVEHGVTGFIVDTPSEAAKAVKKAAQLDRAAIRRRFEERFASSVMAWHYNNLYFKMHKAESQEAQRIASAVLIGKNGKTNGIKDRRAL